MQRGREKQQGEMLSPEDSDQPVNPQSPGSLTSQTWAPREEQSAAPHCFESLPSPCCGTGTNELTPFHIGSSEIIHTKIMWRKSYSLQGKIRMCNLGKQSVIRPFCSTHSGVRWVCYQLLHLVAQAVTGGSPEQLGGDMRAQPVYPPLRRITKVSFLKDPESSS